jgi:hypothetical protein
MLLNSARSAVDSIGQGDKETTHDGTNANSERDDPDDGLAPDLQVAQEHG